MRQFLPRTLAVLSVAILFIGTMMGCDGFGGSTDDALQSTSYVLTAQENDSAVPEGLSATATFWALGPAQTLVTLELEDVEDAPSSSLVAHIYSNSVSEGGGIRFFLAPIDVDGGGTSAKIIDRSYSELIAFDGHISLYTGGANIRVAQGNIGANADGQTGGGLDLVENGAVTEYALSANANDGAIAGGVAGTARFIELTPTQTLVQLQLTDGPTGALLTHPAHIHANSVSEGGDIAIYLSPIDGNGNSINDGASSKIVDRPYDELVAFDGHINIHQSHGNLEYIIAQGNIGANNDSTE
jgi:hypothetical protein